MKSFQDHFVSRLLRRFREDRAGASAIEFVLLLPFLFLLLAGTVDLGQGLTVQRKMNQIASTTAEIVSMQSSWTHSDISTILSGVSSILEPYDLTGLTILICVVNIDTNNKATVVWSAAYHTTALPAGQASPIDIPKDLREDDTQMIVTRVQYKLETVFSALFERFTGIHGYEYDRHFLTRPRNGNTISYS
ncbi:TadE/TadG family type IV pilus assembly protein [Rhizobium herbae]|uniref:Flp pilus assembly protein TadG n=1 Tax=Rhizobium herbae TaxID=508661 RepID=A0ABS4EQ23_9HYPH|nr:TadE/TadG family type IV pilus assembly protein [Rhizobium herbae]MBP1860045.1 Flp pilus assembly protein TadG [Rhizobium herbae]